MCVCVCVCVCIPAPAEVASCISTNLIDSHTHLSISNAQLGLLQLWLYLGLKDFQVSVS